MREDQSVSSLFEEGRKEGQDDPSVDGARVKSVRKGMRGASAKTTF